MAVNTITIQQAVQAIQNGQVGVLPTDTVYGLVAAAANPDAVNRMYVIKQRDTKPGTIIAASIDQLVELGIARRYVTAVAQYWPGAVSVVIPAVEQHLAYLHRGKQTLAVRIPDKPAVQALLMQTGPLATTSANMPGEPTAISIHEAQAVFHKTVDFYVDGGDMIDAQPSTVIRVVDDAVEVLREGAVAIKEQ